MTGTHLRPHQFLLRGQEGQQRQGTVRPFQGEAVRLQAACVGTVHKQGGIHTLLVNTCWQYGRSELASGHGGHAQLQDTRPE